MDYATLDADGLPDVIPEVEAAIASGSSIRRLRRHFPRELRKRVQVERYISKSFRRRFSLHATDGHCVCCDRDTKDVATIAWFYETRRNFRIGADSNTSLVTTRHSMCAHCFLDWHERARWPRRLFALAGVSTAVYVGLFIIKAAFFRRGSSEGMWWFDIARYVSIGVSLIASIAGTLVWRSRVPRPLKSLMPRWMRCSGYESFDRRADLLSDADERVDVVRPMGTKV